MLFLRISEKWSYTWSTDTYEHFNEVRTGDIEELNSCFARNCSGKQCLTCTGRTIKKNTLRDLRTELLVFLRILQEVNDLLELFLLFNGTCNIRELNLILAGIGNSCSVAAEAEYAVAVSALSCDAEEQYHDNDKRNTEHSDINYQWPVKRLWIIVSADLSCCLCTVELQDKIINKFIRNILRNLRV